ncbi:MAG: glycosyltransferase family 2 protein [Acidimicrobiales bacterium]
MAPAAFLDLADRVRAADDADRVGDRPEITVVIPMFDEEPNVGPLLAELIPVLEPIGTYEVIFVDDCSRDRSREVVLEARAENPNVKLVELARNFGHQGALSAGYDHARGRAVVVMDADLQDTPAVITQMVERWREGYDVVYAVREKRKEGAILRASFFVFYRLLQRISEVDLPLDSGDFCLLDRKVVEAMRSLPEANRFLRGLRGWVGFRQTGITYERAARHSGETKYSIRGRVRFAIDGLLSFSDVPLRLASYAGFLTLFAAMLYLIVAIVAWLIGGEVVRGWTSIIFVVLVAGGVQLLILGVFGEYLSRIYQETKRRPPYVLRATHGAAYDAPGADRG